MNIWCTFGQRWSKRVKMEFKDIFNVADKYMADGYTKTEFFREFMSMITSIEDFDWDTKMLDPSENKPENTIRNYIKRGFSKVFAKQIVDKLTPENLEERINALPQTTRSLFATDLKEYDPYIDCNNVGQKVSEWVVEIVRTKAGFVPRDNFSRLKTEKLSNKLKQDFGNYLLEEEQGRCAFPGCNRHLIKTNKENGKTIDSFKVSVIDTKKEPTLDNVIAFCPLCYDTFELDRTQKRVEALKAVKNTLSGLYENSASIEELMVDENLQEVIKNVSKLKEKDFFDAELHANMVNQKINKNEHFALYSLVNNFVTTYFVRLREIMIDLDREKIIDYEEVQDQIHAIYKRLKKTGKSQEVIFDEITNKLHSCTLQEKTYCQIIVSYFVQSCEVFDAVAE